MQITECNAYTCANVLGYYINLLIVSCWVQIECVTTCVHEYTCVHVYAWTVRLTDVMHAVFNMHILVYILVFHLCYSTGKSLNLAQLNWQSGGEERLKVPKQSINRYTACTSCVLFSFWTFVHTIQVCKPCTGMVRVHFACICKLTDVPELFVFVCPVESMLKCIRMLICLMKILQQLTNVWGRCHTRCPVTIWTHSPYFHERGVLL